MALISSLLRNTLRQFKVNPVKNLILHNQLRLTSCTGINHLPIISKDKKTHLSNTLLKLDAVKPFSTSPTSLSAHGDHSKIWTAERALSGALLAIIPAALLAPSQFLDSLMALGIVMHMHWGIEAIVIDYVRPVIFGTIIPKIGVMFVYALSIFTLAGLLNFIFNDVGLANGIRLLWKL